MSFVLSISDELFPSHEMDSQFAGKLFPTIWDCLLALQRAGNRAGSLACTIVISTAHEDDVSLHFSAMYLHAWHSSILVDVRYSHNEMLMIYRGLDILTKP
jgi:hypothetical protein